MRFNVMKQVEYQHPDNRKTFHLDRLPMCFNEGPFWGNGTVGSLMYFEGNVMRIAYDHVLLWETRDTCGNNPKASFQQIKKNRDKYSFQGNGIGEDSDLVFPTFPFTAGPSITRLPALTVKICLPSAPKDFIAETDLTKAITDFYLCLDDGRAVNGKIYVHSLINLIEIELDRADFGEKMLSLSGWDYSSGELRIMKNWGYAQAEKCWQGDMYHLVQHFGENRSAVMSAYNYEENGKSIFVVVLDVDDKCDDSKLMNKNSDIINQHVRYRNHDLKMHIQSWKKFWEKSMILIPEPELQNAYDVEMYKLFCNERKNATPVTLQGIWNNDKRMPPWLGDLHNDLNVQACYWAAFKTGHIDLIFPYIKYYSAAVPHFEKRAKLFTGIEDAVQVPTMMELGGKGAGGEWCFWNTLLGPELYVAIDFCWYYEFSQDKAILQEYIYPYLVKVIHLYKGLAEEGDDGKLHIYFTQSPELFYNGGMLFGEDSTFIISSLRYVLTKTIHYEKILNKKKNTELTDFLDRLVAEPVSEKGLQIMRGVDLYESHRHFSHMFPIFPLGALNRSIPSHNELQVSLDGIRKFGFTGYASWSFPYLSILAARCGRGNMARMLLEVYCMCFRSPNSFTVNGDAYNTGILADSGDSAGDNPESFTLEAGLIVPAALAEMMVHRAEAFIFVLTAIPDNWKWCKGKGLTLEGAHTADVRMEEYRLDELVIKPGMDETITVVCEKAKGEYILLNGNLRKRLSVNKGLHLMLDLVKGVEVRISLE